MFIAKANRRIRKAAKAWFFMLRTCFELRHVERRNPIVVYQMGKVGSSTVAQTLQGLGVPYPVLQVHILSPAQFRRAVVRQRELGVRFFDEHLVVSERLIRKLGRSVFPCRIITLTREPVSRAISFVFQDVSRQAPDALCAGGRVDREAIVARIAELLETEHPAADPGRWFDSELREVFGCDVFSCPHDFRRGYTILNGCAVPVLVMRMEDLDQHLPTALSEFLGSEVSQDAILRANVGEKKRYAADLEWVKRNLRIPRQTLLRIVDTKYFQHFYSRERDAVLRHYSEAPARQFVEPA